MTAEHKYEMTISLQIVEHLGLNLYSNTSAVISEAVANAWDADAKTVEITLEKDCITIKDDGCGMDTDDINNKYLTVGYQKRHLVPITPMLNRKVMGRKGIGKLSLLSIAETITIRTTQIFHPLLAVISNRQNRRKALKSLGLLRNQNHPKLSSFIRCYP